jgi:hypothetical protein
MKRLLLTAACQNMISCNPITIHKPFTRKKIINTLKIL